LTTIGFDGIAGFLDGHRTRATEDLATYFTTYTGRWFEHFSARSDPNHLDANDIAACAALSVELNGKTVDGLMSRVTDIDTLLADCPDRATQLWDIDPSSSGYTALTELYELVRTINGMGPVRTSKLLASKRPHLVPIRDSVVETLLGAGDQWWAPWRTVVADADLRDLVESLTPDTVPVGTSVLRRLDVVLWMYGSHT
jgi:hypothetical protein